MRKTHALVVGAILAICAFAVLAKDPIWAHEYRVWNVVPGSVVDQDGRTGRIYSDGSNILFAVVFEKGSQPRHGGTMDRLFTPTPSMTGICAEIIFDRKMLQGGTGESDEVFDDFLLRRIQGVGWNGDGVVYVESSRKGNNLKYVATRFDGEVMTVKPGPRSHK